MKPKCRHKWEFTGQSPNGQDRVLKYYRCRKCPKTCRRNLKKPRYVAKETPFKEVKPRKRLRVRSVKRQKQEAEYAVLRRKFLEENPVCQVCASEAADQVHHTMGREKDWLLKTEHFIAVCGDCHHFIESNRAEAAKRGLLKLRLTTDQLNSHGT